MLSVLGCNRALHHGTAARRLASIPILTSTLHRDKGEPGVRFIPYTMYMRSDRNHGVRVSAGASCYNLHCRRYPGAPRPERRVCLL